MCVVVNKTQAQKQDKSKHKDARVKRGTRGI